MTQFIKRNRIWLTPAIICGVIVALMFEWARPHSIIAQYTGATAPAWWAGTPTTQYTAVTAAIDAVDNYVDTEVGALRDSLEDANDHLQALRGVTTGAIDCNVWNSVEVVINLASAGAWEEAATHEVLTITGDVELEIAITCSTDCASTSSDSMWWFLGEAGATGSRMISFSIDQLDTGEGLIPLAGWARGWLWDGADDYGANDLGSVGTGTMMSGVLRLVAHMGKDFGYQISDHPGTGGIITVFCRWRPLSTGGSVAAGAGVAL